MSTSVPGEFIGMRVPPRSMFTWVSLIGGLSWSFKFTRWRRHWPGPLQLKAENRVGIRKQNQNYFLLLPPLIGSMTLNMSLPFEFHSWYWLDYFSKASKLTEIFNFISFEKLSSFIREMYTSSRIRFLDVFTGASAYLFGGSRGGGRKPLSLQNTRAFNAKGFNLKDCVVSAGCTTSLCVHAAADQILQSH